MKFILNIFDAVLSIAGFMLVLTGVMHFVVTIAMKDSSSSLAAIVCILSIYAILRTAAYADIQNMKIGRLEKHINELL